MEKPWLEQGVIGDGPVASPLKKKLGLAVFLAVVGCLFALLISAYLVRMDAERPLPSLNLLWINSAVLLASSAALQMSLVAARRNDLDLAEIALSAGGALALCFLVGQALAWRQLNAAGYFLATSPAVAFLILLTGLHGLHLAGGVVALGRTAGRAWRGVDPLRLRASIELCAIYWHFLLVIWLVLFAVLSGWGKNFVVICRGLIS